MEVGPSITTSKAVALGSALRTRSFFVSFLPCPFGRIFLCLKCETRSETFGRLARAGRDQRGIGRRLRYHPAVALSSGFGLASLAHEPSCMRELSESRIL